MRKIARLGWLLLVVFSLWVVQAYHQPSPVLAQAEKITPELRATLANLPAESMTTVIVVLSNQVKFDQFLLPQRERVVTRLQAAAARQQSSLKSFLMTEQAQGRVQAFTAFWIFNGFSITTTAGVIEQIAARPDVIRIEPEQVFRLRSGITYESIPVEASLAQVGAPGLWSAGYTGQGVVVAILDSGVNGYHADLYPRYRGGSNSWFDPYGQQPVPSDPIGHGSMVAGVLVGGSAGGSQIGMAPGSQWIAARIFNNAGQATSTAIHSVFQWVLDPDQNPLTDDAPDVINNSWGFDPPACSLAFQLDIQAIRSAGILPIFSAGNYGASVAGGTGPANYPESLAVGAVGADDTIAGYSSRGPSSCGQAESIYPEVVAPGNPSKTTANSGSAYSYQPGQGTSFAAPHVSGGLALLLSAYPDLTVDQQEQVLLQTALDLGPVGPDNDYGYGRLNLPAAMIWLEQQFGPPAPPPAPSPTPMVTPIPTTQSTYHQFIPLVEHP